VALTVSRTVAKEMTAKLPWLSRPPPPPPPSHPASAELQSLLPPSLKTAGIQLPSASDPRPTCEARTLDRPTSAMPTRSTPATTTTITSTVVATMGTVCPVDISPGLRRLDVTVLVDWPRKTAHATEACSDFLDPAFWPGRSEECLRVFGSTVEVSRPFRNPLVCSSTRKPPRRHRPGAKASHAQRAVDFLHGLQVYASSSVPATP
jgi:hypothetical protein